MLVAWVSLAVSLTTLIGGALFRATLDAREERMRREITAEITKARHDAIDRAAGSLSATQAAVLGKVDRDLYDAHHQEVLRRLTEVEKALWIRGS